MRKWMILILCLMLVLPVSVYAEDTESQPAPQTESQPAQQTESQPPQQTESQPPQQTESQPPQQTESQPPQQTESQPPQQTESQPPQQTESQPPQQTETQPADHTHVWDVSATVPATCLEEGATAYGCSACGAITYEILPKLTTHTYDNACDTDCNVCGGVREASHKFSTQWTRKAKGHWHACTVCGAEGDFGNHYPGPAATEEKAQICLTCGYTLTAKLGHTHKYDTKFTSDETGHWYACDNCEDQKDFETHSYDDGCDPDCNVCGYVTSTAHMYSGSWLSDDQGHWDVCTICQEQSALEPHIAGPDATDAEAQVCLACGFELAAPLAHIHEGQGSWLTDEENHWKICACGENTDENPHIWDAGEEQEDSTILYTCEDCGATRTEGEPKAAGISPLVWMGAIVVALLGAAAALVFLLIPRLGKGGKYGK